MRIPEKMAPKERQYRNEAVVPLQQRIRTQARQSLLDRGTHRVREEVQALYNTLHVARRLCVRVLVARYRGEYFR